MDERNILNELTKVATDLRDIGYKLGEEKDSDISSEDKIVDQILITIDYIAKRIKFINQEVSRLDKEK